MAFLLRFNTPLNGQGDQASFTTPIPMEVGDRFEYDGVIPSSGNPSSAIFLIQNSSNYFAFNGDNAARIGIAGVLTTGATASLAPYLDLLTTYIIERFSDRYEIRVGTDVLVTASTTDQLTIARWGQGGTSSYVNMDFYEGRFYSSDVLAHRWIPSGTGSTVNDSVGANHLTLENFPTDDSQYIEYIGLNVDQETAAPGDSMTWTTELVGLTGAYLQDDSGNQYPLTNVTDTGGDLPALTGGLQACLFGFVDLVVTDGVDTVSSPIELTPPAGYELVALESIPPTLVPTDWVYGFDIAADVGDQSLENNGVITHNVDGSITWTPQALTYTYYTVDASDGVVSEITKTFDSAGALLPTVDAGNNITATNGDTVALSSATASDYDSLLWTCTSGQSPTFSDATALNPNVTFNEVGVHTLQLAATNTEGTTTDALNADVQEAPNVAPTANAGVDQSVAAGAGVTLDGTGSTDSDGTIVSYAWTQTTGDVVTLTDNSTATPSFTAPSANTAQTLTFELTVTDDGGLTGTDTVSIQVAAQSARPFFINNSRNFNFFDSDGIWTDKLRVTETDSYTMTIDPTWISPETITSYSVTPKEGLTVVAHAREDNVIQVYLTASTVGRTNVRFDFETATRSNHVVVTLDVVS